MKYNSYVAQGYQYGLLCAPEENLLELKGAIRDSLGEENQVLEPRGIEEEIKIIPSTVIPFEHVDGLTLEELKTYDKLLYKKRFLVFIMYDILPISKRTNGDYRIEFEDPKIEGYSRYLYAIDTEKNKEATIDEVVEEYFIKNIDKIKSLNVRKRALGFLEKYVHNDKESVYMSIHNYLYDKYGVQGPSPDEYIKIPYRKVDRW